MDFKSNDSKRLKRKEFKRVLKSKKSRIIVRNISFKANEDIIREKFSKFGDIIEVNIPKKSDERMFGFCFINFNDIKSALKAIKGLNGTQLLGRTIAVDFALAKKRFESHNNVIDSVESSDNVIDSQEKEDNDSENESIEKSDTSPKDGESDDNEDMSSDDNQCKPKDNIKKLNPKVLSDASEERTVFVRNLSFLTTVEDLNQLMTQFGKTEYCKICVDPQTEHSKGTAFVKFKNKSDAKKCLESEMESNDGLYLDGRQLTLSLACTRSQIKDILVMRLTKDRDKRNLFLAKEGLIYPESPAAEGVSQSDLSKRLSLETRKRKMLQNNHFFVSKTRLCVHNLPDNYDKQQLRRLFMTAVNDRKAKIIESIVMFDRPKNGKGFGKSKGFGFVEFTEHIHALESLRHLNNNPNIFTEQKRPIVEFSIENKVALNKKKHRMNANKSNSQQKTDLNQPLAEESIEYSGLMSRPNKANEKIKAPKINRKFGEIQKQLKNRGKNIKGKNKSKIINELKHKRKQNTKQNKPKMNETQDSHDLHFKKRRHIFMANEDMNSVKKTKKTKWFDTK